MTRIVVLGDIVTDVVAQLRDPIATGSDTTAEISMSAGGSAANVAAWVARDGADVVFIGCVGADPAGDERVGELAAAGVDVRTAVTSAAPTGTVIVLVTPDGERTMLPDRGANLRLEPRDLPDDVFTTGDHLHVSGYSLFTAPPRDAALEALRRARHAGMTVSVDPSSAAPLAAVGSATFLRWTGGAQICLPNAAEAAVLAGEDDPARAARVLSEMYDSVVVTLGSRGALAWDGSELVEQEAVAANVADTTGAGDAFTAGFLSAYVGGASTAVCLQRGAEVAARAVTRRGGRPPAEE